MKGMVGRRALRAASFTPHIPTMSCCRIESDHFACGMLASTYIVILIREDDSFGYPHKIEALPMAAT
jgi:hypothetical protein